MLFKINKIIKSLVFICLFLFLIIMSACVDKDVKNIQDVKIGEQKQQNRITVQKSDVINTGILEVENINIDDVKGGSEVLGEGGRF